MGKQGFASMTKARRVEIARMGGRAKAGSTKKRYRPTKPLHQSFTVKDETEFGEGFNAPSWKDRLFKRGAK